MVLPGNLFLGTKIALFVKIITRSLNIDSLQSADLFAVFTPCLIFK